MPPFDNSNGKWENITEEEAERRKAERYKQYVDKRGPNPVQEEIDEAKRHALNSWSPEIDESVITDEERKQYRLRSQNPKENVQNAFGRQAPKPEVQVPDNGLNRANRFGFDEPEVISQEESELREMKRRILEKIRNGQ